MAIKFTKFFSHHLNESGENYFEHLSFTVRMSGSIFITFFVLLIHGILPFTFTQTASKRVAKLSKVFENRVQHIIKKNAGIVNYAEAI